ncbi:hypothetical protein ABZ807_32955 [Micromonospora sp. NPDC047548]|uniref:hypothetical protein n=1 Tax=Micromonospora sp. NPDC047548 TaxID=3155624 RepID=UPI0033F843FA
MNPPRSRLRWSWTGYGARTGPTPCWPFDDAGEAVAANVAENRAIIAELQKLWFDETPQDEFKRLKLSTGRLAFALTANAYAKSRGLVKPGVAAVLAALVAGRTAMPPGLQFAECREALLMLLTLRTGPRR